MKIDKGFINSPIYEQMWDKLNIEIVIKFIVIYFFITWI
jgi:hypothetical protein